MENFGLRVQSYVYPADITDADFKAEFTKINGGSGCNRNPDAASAAEADLRERY